jgi:hypothetical protein
MLICHLSGRTTKRSLKVLTAAGLALIAVPCFADKCESLATLALPHTTINQAEVIATGTFAPPTGKPLPDLPAFCRVTATIKPSADSDILVEIWMPRADWNQRLEGTGKVALPGRSAMAPWQKG